MAVGLAERLEIEETKSLRLVFTVGKRQRELILRLRPAERRVALVNAALLKQDDRETGDGAES